MSASQPMPIAIVVIGRRFLDGVQSPDELWLMAECRSTVAPAPADGALLTAAPQSLGITA